MSDGTLEQLTYQVESLRDLANWITGVPDEDDTRSLAEDYGVAEEDYYGDPEEFVGPDHEDVVSDAIRESVLSIDTEITKSIVFGTGGPHSEIEITLSAELQPLRGRVVGYWGGDTVQRHLSSEDVEALAEWFGITE